ncbi:hypothetical protein O1611_g7487 [Lasiodiplodia mahajangana]|uniref:Uncharacterized protein n=1 Tax=Lasiodiplodia mahajangana TaxID=1108764 RepID=A0ACC2JFI3_9PEZI|nr:hypothetical protein O1611_g7487 [Lasiodiplodia mahajangana]
MEVEALIPQLQNTLSEISNTVHGLSIKTQDDELDQLEQKRERLLRDLQTSFEKEKQELETKHRTEVEEIKKKRKQEDEERAARRRREDEELNKASSKEDKQWQQRRDSAVEIVEDETGQEMDQVEEEARRMVDEGKKRLQDLEEKRRDLNRRIDEQLKQSLPTAPSRKDRHKKEAGNVPKDDTNGGSASNALPKKDSTPKDSNKSDTPSKHGEPGDSAAKSPESKKDGELPFQDKSYSLPQAAKEPARKLPKSFAEALKSNMSNELKDKAKLEKGSSRRMIKEADDHIERRSEISLNELKGKDAGTAADISTNTGDIMAGANSVMASTKGKFNNGEKNIINNIELLAMERGGIEGSGNQRDTEFPHDASTTPELIQSGADSLNDSERNASTESKQLNQTSHAQILPCSEPIFTENPEPTIPKEARADQGTQIQLPSEHRRITIIDDTELDQSSESTTIHQISAVQEGESKRDHAPAHASEVEAHTVGSGSTHQPPIPSHTSEKRTSWQRDETDDQVEPRQPATSDSPQQEYSGNGRDSLQAIGQPQPCGQSTKTPVKPVPPTPPSSLRDELSVESDSRRGSGQMRNAATEYLTAEQLARRGSASPLPVENETVRGQDQLFDDHKSVSGHSEPHSGDDESDLSPQTPIEGHDLPVLLGPAFNHKLYEHGLAPLVDESGSWAIVAEQANLAVSGGSVFKLHPMGRKTKHHARIITRGI